MDTNDCDSLGLDILENVDTLILEDVREGLDIYILNIDQVS